MLHAADAEVHPFDSLNLYAVLHECQVLVGGRLQAIRQPEPLTVVLHIYAQRQEYRLLLSADPQFARLHLMTKRLPNAPTPPPFCQSLRKHLDGARLRRIAQIGFDRIVQLEFETAEGLYRLIAELMGKHSNLLLVNPVGLIQSAAKWVSPRQSQLRPIRAG
jgi:predicted ribosome quality control (RQC) complex YloA/Tae2 family protein